VYYNETIALKAIPAKVNYLPGWNISLITQSDYLEWSRPFAHPVTVILYRFQINLWTPNSKISGSRERHMHAPCTPIYKCYYVWILIINFIYLLFILLMYFINVFYYLLMYFINVMMSKSHSLNNCSYFSNNIFFKDFMDVLVL